MKITHTAVVAGLAALAACGGGSSGGGGGVTQNLYTGSITVTGPLGGATTCQGTTAVVRFQAGQAGTDVHSVSVVGGGCVQFQNLDSIAHRPAPRAPNSCAALNGAPAAGLLTGQTFTTQPLGGTTATETCDWMDSLCPPGSCGGGGGY